MGNNGDIWGVGTTPFNYFIYVIFIYIFFFMPNNINGLRYICINIFKKHIICQKYLTLVNFLICQLVVYLQLAHCLRTCFV